MVTISGVGEPRYILCITAKLIFFLNRLDIAVMDDPANRPVDNGVNGLPGFGGYNGGRGGSYGASYGGYNGGYRG